MFWRVISAAWIITGGFCLLPGEDAGWLQVASGVSAFIVAFRVIVWGTDN